MNWTVLWRRSSWALMAMKRPEFARLTSAASRARAACASATAFGSIAAGAAAAAAPATGAAGAAAPEASSKRRPPAKFWEK
jgi:hypothetical protein